jgi:hypothetical protein
MRAILALLAVLVLLAHPAFAGAVQAGCDMTTPASAEATAASAGTPCAEMSVAGDPCCDHAPQHKTHDAGCAQACASGCVNLMAPPVSPAAPLVPKVASFTAAFAVFSKPYQPSGLERPPKSMA